MRYRKRSGVCHGLKEINSKGKTFMKNYSRQKLMEIGYHIGHIILGSDVFRSLKKTSMIVFFQKFMIILKTVNYYCKKALS